MKKRAVSIAIISVLLMFTLPKGAFAQVYVVNNISPSVSIAMPQIGMYYAAPYLAQYAPQTLAQMQGYSGYSYPQQVNSSYSYPQQYSYRQQSYSSYMPQQYSSPQNSYYNPQQYSFYNNPPRDSYGYPAYVDYYTAFPQQSGAPVGQTDLLGNQLCQWSGYDGATPCDFNPHQPLFDTYTGEYY